MKRALDGSYLGSGRLGYEKGARFFLNSLWCIIVRDLPAMKGRSIGYSLGPIIRLSTTCASLRALCCQQMKRMWAQIRGAVIHKINGSYLDGTPWLRLVRLAASGLARAQPDGSQTIRDDKFNKEWHLDPTEWQRSYAIRREQKIWLIRMRSGLSLRTTIDC